ncbi:tetratricopeptide repeat-containing hybrid sensor histidine kinase/response regulator [Flavobacterium agrisoli]|uniref:histidine kinase n=1 Tax=Flavobacterium agrisoli TaxID=2793066 RepID=A0A934UKC3_9FLAO|nr:ATP-binding protein [Flavobacterium agrisoli]MBK0370817.1 response regulator [Flavobacterium agrisoli]
MKKIFLLIFLGFFHYSSFAYPNETQDSIAYYNKIANYNLSLKKTDKAIFFTKKAIEYSLRKKLTSETAFETFKLGKLYYSNKEYDLALKNFNRSILYYNKLQPQTNKGLVYFYLGLTQIAKENYSASENYFDISTEIFQTLGVSDTSGALNLKASNAYLQKKQYDLAKKTLKKTTEKKTIASLSKAKSESFYQLGIIENELKSDSAIVFLEKALQLNSQRDDLNQKSKILLAISKYYKNKHDYDRAYTYLDEHFQLKHHIQEINNAKTEYLAYKTYKKNELLNEAHQREKEEIEAENSEKYTQLVSILAIGLISILSLLSLSLYKNNIIRNQNNIVLKEKNHELLIAKNKAEKASKARAEFLSTVSHELRTPLNAINGITHLLMQEKPKKSQIGYLESLKFSGNYLSTFINEILEINKIESNKLEIEKISFNLKELMTNIKSSLIEMASSNNNEFILNVDEKIPTNLIGDPTKLAQIVMNLINNALKFTQNGQVKVMVNLSEIQNETTALLHFQVIDTGIGIPADKLQTVFESFSQGSVEVNRKYGGTGLGLTIVKKLVEILGGKIKLKSEVGKGSTFSFNLKFDITPVSEVSIEEVDEIYNDAILKNKRILLVEDNKINQMITKKMLQNKEMECFIIDNGEQAIETLKAESYDLVLMDVHLPGINGTTATQSIRAFDTKTPIIALTAISLEENRDSLLAFGMNDVITKPFVPEEFYAIIAKYLEQN